MKHKNTFFSVLKPLLIILFYSLISFNSLAQISKEEFTKFINTNELKHPYLFFSDEDKQILLERIKSDPRSKKIMDGLLAEGHRFLRMPFVKKTLYEPENPRYATDGEAVSYIAEISQAATTLSFLYQITGDVDYAKKAVEFAIALSDVPEWVNGAHKFDIIYPRVWPWNVPDDQVVFSFDITAARRARTLAIVYDWLYPVLSKHERDKIRSALLEKAITRVRGNYDFHWWATSYRCNWTAVCFGGLGVTALALLKDDPQLIDVVTESYNRLNLTFDQIGEDGGWQEGRGYYGFMLEHSVYFMDALKRVSKGKFNLFNHKKIYDHTFDFALFALTASFGDSYGGPIGGTYLVNKMTEETGNKTSAWYSKNFVREDPEIMDILWPKTTVEPIEPAVKSKLFRSIDWAVMRTDFLDPSTVTVVTKAGFNDDPHHGHLDIGHFILTYQNVPFIKDLGRMEYDEFYFSEDRYNYPQATSLGHNVIFVNGEEQIIAKKKNQSWKEGIGGKIIDFQTSEKRDYVLMDPTKAYPGKELKKWRRSIILEKPVITVVFDEVGSNSGAEIEARFFPGVGTGREISPNRLARMLSNPDFDISRLAEQDGEYKVYNNYVYLSDNRKHNMALIPLVLDNNFKMIEDEIPAIPVMEDAKLSWLKYFGTSIQAKSNTSIIVTIILPVNDQHQAETIVESAKINQLSSNEIEISINTDSGDYKWLFVKNKDGYVFMNK